MPLLRTEEHDGLVCKFYDGGVVKVGTTAADRFSIRLKDDEDFATRLKKELEERRARLAETKHKGREKYRKRPNAKEDLKAISAKNQKIYDERLEARQAATKRNAEERRARCAPGPSSPCCAYHRRAHGRAIWLGRLRLGQLHEAARAKADVRRAAVRVRHGSRQGADPAASHVPDVLRF